MSMTKILVSVFQLDAPGVSTWSTFPCEQIEECPDATGRKFVRIKYPDGDIKRVYHDRVRPFSKQPDKSEEKTVTTEPNQYDPWAECKDGEVYERNNTFSATTICKTIMIIDKAANKYYTINTYNGVAKAGKMEYQIDDLKKLLHKIEKKKYVKLTKGAASAK